MKYYWLYFVISGIFILPGIYSLLKWGVKPSIDFTGGSLIEITSEATDSANLQKEMIEKIASENEIEISLIKQSGDNGYLIQSKTINQETNTNFQEKLASASGTIIKEQRFETLGPSLGSEMLTRALTAIGIAVLVILAFIWKQFKDKKYGICAILAMLHDSLLIFGVFSLLGHFAGVEVDTLFMTAVLTILSFSVHDTIVVYDRIRESRRNLPKASFEDILDKTVNETLARGVNNSMTIIFMLLCLYLMGGETIKWFVFALLIGTISGTYSSTFTAVPLLKLWDKVFGKK
jgi:preprotein translocase subunit SecF